MKITVLAGGVGAARFLAGLVRVAPPGDVVAVVNTGDDFQWMGLQVCPDLDTVLYTLAGLSNPDVGWGLRNDTFHCLDRLEALGADAWFRIGDRDLATHLFRTVHLARGSTLTQVTAALSRAHAVETTLLPMTDSPVPTTVYTDEGALPFQEYFVQKACRPVVRGVGSENAESVRPAPGVIDALLAADSIIVCPSNPFISIGPILRVPGIRDALEHTRAVRVAVSPIIAGRAVKGPTATMLRDLGLPVSAVSIAEMYRELADIFVLDRLDDDLRRDIDPMGMRTVAAETLMTTLEAATALARTVVECIDGHRDTVAG